MIELANAHDARTWVQSFARSLARPAVVLLAGDLGAGKTQFSRWIGEELGTTEVASPTFAIHHEYQTPTGVIDHVDLYRLRDDAELEGVGFWDLLTRDDALLLVEWADRLPVDVWPKTWTVYTLEIKKEAGERRRVRLTVTPPLGAPTSGQSR